MKQNLLNKLWLRVGMIVAVMTTALAGTAAETKTFDFKFETIGTTGWSNSYAAHSYEYTEGTVKFTAASKQTSTITTMPVTKGQPVEFIMKDGYTISSAKFECQQWTTKAQTITLHYSTDGGENYTSTDVTSSNFTISSDKLPAGTNAVKITFSSTSNQIGVKNLTLTYATSGGSGDTSVSTSVTIDASGITNTDVYAGTAAGSLSATVVAGETTLSGATVTWSGNNNAVATIDASTGVVTLVAAGTVTFTAEYAGVDGTYKPSSKTYEMTVTNSDPNVPGTETNPYTVAEARAAIDAGTGVTGVYATGIVSKIVTAYNSTYGNISYNISADGTETADQLQAYRGFSYNGDWFTSADDIQVGDVVVVYGNLKKYNSTYEFDSGNQLVSLDRPVVTTPSITVDPATVNAPYTGTTGTINVTYNNVYPNVGVDTEWYTDATCATTTAAPSWIEVSYDSENNVTYTIQENDGSEARTAYMKIWSYSAPEVIEYSEVITFSQAAYVVGYATLPFWWSGGKADIESTAGLSQEGLGDDYSISPKLKFDSTGDWLLLQFNERPTKLSFEIKGNPSGGVWAGTFTVQTSEDGVTYTDLKSYTELTSVVKSEPFDNLGENVRYIKWVYTEKVSGNVALGNIVVDKYSVDPAISISSNTVNVGAVAANNALMTEGTLDITLENITISDMAQFEVKYLTSSLESTTKPEWLDVVVAEQDPSVGEGYVVSYTVMDNDGKARSAYFQVYGLDDDGSTEALSQVVTIEQAAYVAPATGDQYALFTGNLVEGDYIIYYDGYAMNTDVENGRLMYAEVTPESDVITTSNAAIVWHIAKSGDYWTIYNAETNAYAASTGVKNKAQMLADGTDDMALWTVSDEYEFVNKANSKAGVNANLRNNGTFGFACYSTSTGGALSLYKKVGDTPVPTSQTVIVSAAGYATMVAASDLVIPSDVEVFAVEIRGERAHLERVTTGIPAGEAVVVRADEGEYVFNYATETVDALTVTNDLIAATEPVITDGRQYVLAKPGNEEVGFYKAAGTIAAGKAYLQISGEAPVKGFTFIFNDDATGIEMVNGQSSMVNDPIFNLAGQRIQKLQRGINIVGGKKVMVK